MLGLILKRAIGLRWVAFLFTGLEYAFCLSFGKKGLVREPYNQAMGGTEGLKLRLNYNSIEYIHIIK